MQKLTPEVIRQLNNLGGGFPPAPSGSNNEPQNDEQWILGDWTFECRVRPGVSALVDLPALDNTLGDVRFVIGLGAWYWWDGAAWAPVTGGAVTAVTATGPLASSGGTTPDVSFPSWPAPNAPGVLTNDGSGTLSWGATTGSQDVVWYGVGRLSDAADLAGWQSSTVKTGGSVDVVDNLPLYLKCHWRFTGTETLSDNPFEETKPPFANLAAFEAYVNGLRAAGIATGSNALFAQPFDVTDGNVPKIPDFVAKNNLWSMLFAPDGARHKSWSPRSQNAVYSNADGGSRLDDTVKSAYLTAVWNACFGGGAPSFADPFVYRCFWRAQPKRNLWTWSRQFVAGGRPQLFNDRRAYNAATSTIVTPPGGAPYPEFEVDPAGQTAVLRVGEPYTAQWSAAPMKVYTSYQKSGLNNDLVSSSAVLCIPLRNVVNPDEKAVYIKPLSQDTWIFRWFDSAIYDIEAVCYGGANADNGYPVLRTLPGSPFADSAQQNVGRTSSLWALNTLPVVRVQALRLRPGNRVRFRFRDKLTGRVGPFADAAMELRRDKQNPDLIRLLQASPR